MAIESRAAWGARKPRSVSYVSKTKGVKAHYTGGHVNPATLTDHAKCRAAIRGIQNGHMDGNGWADIAYSMWVCNHTAGMGRGPGVLTAANGPGLNADHYSILFLVGTSGVTEPTDNMKRHFHEARDYLRSKGGAGAEIKGHRDGYATSCPGEPIYKWIKAGAKLPATPKPGPQPAPKEDDDEMKYGSLGYNGDPVDVPAGEWWRVPLDTEYADPYGDHSGKNQTFLVGSAYFCMEGAVTLTGVPAGTKVEIMAAEYEYDSSVTPAVDRLVEKGDPTVARIEEDGTLHHAAVGHCNKNHKLCLVVRTPVPAKLARARVRYLAQK